MEWYKPNPGCDCARCRMHGLMGPAVLIALGVLFLVGEFTRWEFDETWPVLLLVIGLVLLLRAGASVEGHVQSVAQIPSAPSPVPTQAGEFTERADSTDVSRASF
jgi:hypothetical protein